MGNSGNITGSVCFQILICSEGEYQVRIALRRSVTSSSSKAIAKSNLLFKGSSGKVLSISPSLMTSFLELPRGLLTIPPSLIALLLELPEPLWYAERGRRKKAVCRLAGLPVQSLHHLLWRPEITNQQEGTTSVSNFLPIIVIDFRLCSWCGQWNRKCRNDTQTCDYGQSKGRCALGNQYILWSRRMAEAVQMWAMSWT